MLARLSHSFHSPSCMGRRRHDRLAAVALLLAAAVLIAAGMPGRAAEAAPDIRLLWVADTRSSLMTAATVADIDGDGLGEILIGGMNAVIAYDGDGNRLWEWPTTTRFCTYPAVLVREGEKPLIYAADNAGNFMCLDGQGKEVWHARMNAASNWSAAVVADVNGDDRPEVIQTDDDGGVYAFDALTGKAVWKVAAKGGIGSSPSVGSLSGARTPEVVVATEDGFLTVIAGDGSPAWERQLGRGLMGPVIFTAGDGAGRVVVGSHDGEVFCLGSKGDLVWQHSAGSPLDASISVGDIDLDGRADIFLVTTAGTVERLGEDGGVIWRLDVHMRSDASGAIADVNGDGKLEYILCLHAARLLVLDDGGGVIFDYDLKVNNAYNATPTFGDVTKASPGLEMVICGGDGGKLFCFGTPAPNDAVVQWGAYRRDYTMAGSWPGLARSATATMSPEDVAWNTVLTGQGVRFTVTNANPSAGPLRAQAACLTPDGARRAVTADIADAADEVVLPLEVLAPGLYSFSWSLRDAGGKTLVSGARDVTLQPFANDRGLVNRASASLTSVAEAVRATLPLSASALRREARLLDDTAAAAAPLQDACLCAGSSAQRDAIERTTALAEAARRDLRVADIVRQAVAVGRGTSVIAFQGPTWTSQRVADMLPGRVSAGLEVTRQVVPGEHEPVAVNLFNITDRELQVRVVIDAPQGVTVVPHRALAVPTAIGLMAWDALPELDETASISIPSLSSRQLWLDAATAENVAGKQQITVRLQAINGAGVLEAPQTEEAIAPPETQVVINLDVLPFRMAPAGSFRLCTWAYVESSQFKDIADATYADLWSHGNNVFVILAMPEAKYDDGGRLVGPVDYTKVDAYVKRWQGKNAVLLLNGFPALAPASGKGEYGGPAYRKALKPYLNDLAAHMASLGFTTDDFALYPIDEAGGDGWPSIHAQAEFGKMIRAANPKVKIYADAGGPDPAMMEEIAPYVDIWSPGVNLVSTEPAKFNIMKATGKTLWSYNCSYNNYNKALRDPGTLKVADIVSEYRGAGIWAFRHNLTGAGFWTYCTSPEDPWTRTMTEYVMVYPGRTMPVTSRRWEGVREGIEDFRILAALKARLDATGAAALPEEVRERVRHLLEVSVPQYVDGITDEPKLERLRGEMLDCVEAVAG